MSPTLEKTFCGIVVTLFLAILFLALFPAMFFAIKHSESRAVAELEKRGFSEVGILEKFVVGSHFSLLPIETHFIFIAGDQKRELVCPRLWRNIWEEGCVVWE